MIFGAWQRYEPNQMARKTFNICRTLKNVTLFGSISKTIFGLNYHYFTIQKKDNFFPQLFPVMVIIKWNNKINLRPQQVTEVSVFEFEVEYLDNRMNPLNTAFLNTNISPFKQQYCIILAKSSKHCLYRTIKKTCLSGRLTL